MTLEVETLKELGRSAFRLATLLALKANLHAGRNASRLALAEAFLGSGSAWFKTGHQFRAARVRLERLGYATFRKTAFGWIGKLNDGRLFRIFPDSHYEAEDKRGPGADHCDHQSPPFTSGRRTR
jgi:hypothetical protein